MFSVTAFPAFRFCRSLLEPSPAAFYGKAWLHRGRTTALALTPTARVDSGDPGENPSRHMESMQTAHRTASGPRMDSPLAVPPGWAFHRTIKTALCSAGLPDLNKSRRHDFMSTVPLCNPALASAPRQCVHAVVKVTV